jgi:hypothetical protein
LHREEAEWIAYTPENVLKIRGVANDETIWDTQGVSKDIFEDTIEKMLTAELDTEPI